MTGVSSDCIPMMFTMKACPSIAAKQTNNNKEAEAFGAHVTSSSIRGTFVEMNYLLSAKHERMYPILVSVKHKDRAGSTVWR